MHFPEKAALLLMIPAPLNVGIWILLLHGECVTHSSQCTRRSKRSSPIRILRMEGKRGSEFHFHYYVTEYKSLVKLLPYRGVVEKSGTFLIDQLHVGIQQQRPKKNTAGASSRFRSIGSLGPASRVAGRNEQSILTGGEKIPFLFLLADALQNNKALPGCLGLTTSGASEKMGSKWGRKK